METYAKYPPRVILVIGNTTVTQPPLDHDGIEAGIGHGAGAAPGLADKSVDSSVAAVLLLELPVTLAAQVEGGTADSGSRKDDADDHAGHDTTDIATAAFGVARRGSRDDLGRFGALSRGWS